MSQIDIFIPCYNAEKYLEKTLNSIQAQTYTDFNVIIINDGSTDGSAEIIKKYAEGDSRIHVLDNGKNRGIHYTRNRGLEECQAEYIAYMDADDEMPSYRLEHQMNYLKEHPECDVLAGGMQLMSEEGIKGKEILFGECTTEDVYAALFFHNIISNGSVIVKRKFIKKHEIYYDEKSLSLEDYNFWVDCMKAGANMHVMNEVLEYYRIVQTGLSRTNVLLDKIEARKASFNFIHQKILNFYSICLSEEQKQMYFKYTNEFSKKRIEKIKDFSTFMFMLGSMKRQNPFETDAFTRECRKFRKRVYHF